VARHVGAGLRRRPIYVSQEEVARQKILPRHARLGFAGRNPADLLVGDLLIAVLVIDVSAPFLIELVVILGFEMLPA
jgi:hypothetical protein